MKSSMLANMSGAKNLMGTTFISRLEVRARVSMSGGEGEVTGHNISRESLLHVNSSQYSVKRLNTHLTVDKS